MSSSFPQSTDTFVNPQSTDSMLLVSHSSQHDKENDGILAVQKYLIAGKTVTISRTQGADYYCDGTADNVQIQAAIDYVTGLTKGGTVFIKSGNYYLASGLTILSGLVTLEGEGRDITTLWCDSLTTGAGLAVGDNITYRSGGMVRDLSFNSNTTLASVDGIHLNYHKFCGFHNVTINGLFRHGINVDNHSRYNRFEDCYIIGVTGNGRV